MKNPGWATFIIGDGYKPLVKRDYTPPAGQGHSGVDRRKLDDILLKRQLERANDISLDEEWVDETD